MRAARRSAVLLSLLGLMVIGFSPIFSSPLWSRAGFENENVLPREEESLSPGTSDEKSPPHFTPETVERGREYRSTKYLVFFLRTALTLFFLFIVVKMRGMEWVGSRLESSLPGIPWLVAGVYAAIITVALAAVSLPVNIYSGFLHEHAFGLSTRDLAGWLADFGKYLLLQVLLAFVIFAGLYWIMGASPAWWWIVAASLFTVFVVVMTAFSPLVIDPLFNKFTPIEDESLKREIVDLSKRAGLDVESVYEMNASLRTRKLNAYFTGLGSTKRVVIYDNLLRKSSREEVMMVLAHELGHWRRGHLWKGIGLAAIGTCIVVFIISRVLSSGLARGWGIPSFDHPTGVPLIVLIILLCGFLSMPVQNAVSRHFERQADMDSLLLTGDPDTFIRVEERMARVNLNDVDPHPVIEWLLFTHPSTLERIQMAEEFKKTLPARRGEENQ
jgi:STE24 endopeptidase